MLGTPAAHTSEWLRSWIPDCSVPLKLQLSSLLGATPPAGLQVSLDQRCQHLRLVSRSWILKPGPDCTSLSQLELPDCFESVFQKSVVCDGVEVPVHLIGDASFPLRPWLMKGYSQQHQLSPERRRFSYTLSSACSVVDAAFARLKGRWRCLLKKSDIDVSMMPRVVAACCVLHNICEHRGDAFLPEWSGEAAPSARRLRQPDTEPHDGDAFCTAEVIREAISCNLLSLLT